MLDPSILKTERPPRSIYVAQLASSGVATHSAVRAAGSRASGFVLWDEALIITLEWQDGEHDR